MGEVSCDVNKMYHHCHTSAPDIATIIGIDFGNVVLDLVCFLNLLQILKLENIEGDQRKSKQRITLHHSFSLQRVGFRFSLPYNFSRFLTFSKSFAYERNANSQWKSPVAFAIRPARETMHLFINLLCHTIRRASSDPPLLTLAHLTVVFDC